MNSIYLKFIVYTNTQLSQNFSKKVKKSGYREFEPMTIRSPVDNLATNPSHNRNKRL